jgi:hypothetical protein
MIGIMNAALLAQGQQEITTENDGSLEFRTMFRNWPSIVEAELEDGKYHFTKQQSHLVTRSPGKFGFSDAYLVPREAMHVRNLWLLDVTGERYQTDWIQDGSYVYVDKDDGCYIEWVNAPDPDLWSATFVRAVQMKMEALILRSVKEEYGEADSMDMDAENMFQRARTNSTKARSVQQAYQKGPIARARRRNGRRING